MEIILLEKIHNLGNLGDKVRVRAGYGRNYLIPRKKAVPATVDNVAKFEAQRAELEKAQQAALDAAKSRAERMQNVELRITARAGNEGRLFGSVGTPEIVAALATAGFEVEKREVRLPNGPLRNLGRHQVEIGLHADVSSTIAIDIVTEGGPQ